jgi:hypothetical protein
VSDHTYGVDIPVPDIHLGENAARVERISGAIGALGLLLCIVATFVNRAEFFQSYLFAFLYWGGFTIGGTGVLLMHHTVGGKWGVTIRRLLEAQVRTLPLLAVLIIPIFFGLRYIYPWAVHQFVMQSPVLRYKAPYLNVPFFIGRVVLYFAVWFFWGFRDCRMADMQDETGDPTLKERMRAFSAPGVLVFTLTGTFAYIDWILSADVQFFSTVYGAMILIGDVLQAIAMSIVALVLASREDRFGGRVNAPVLHDLGNMMFAFVIFWAYLSASQLIIVWPGNLPQEIGWYLDRIQGFWKYLAAVTALSMFAIPFCLLLSQDRKRHPIRLFRVALFILFARLVDMFWIVEPTFRSASHESPLITNRGFAIYWTDFAAFLFVGGIWVYAYVRHLRRRPLLPLHDPRVAEPLPEAVA